VLPLSEWVQNDHDDCHYLSSCCQHKLDSRVTL